MLPQVLTLEHVAHSAQRVWSIPQRLPAQRDVGGLVLQEEGQAVPVGWPAALYVGSE